MHFPYSDDNKRYHTLAYHNRHTYGCRVFKAAVDARFTCPNIDGTCGSGGCIFCDGGSGYFTAESSVSVTEQIQRERARILAKCPSAKIIAYFQAHSNTYAAPERLSALYREAISCGVSGLAVATRADCIDDSVAQLLAQLSSELPVTVELGLQSAHDSTARLINRGHSFGAFLRGYSLVKQAGLRVCVHIINGLPSETPEMMLETARELARLAPDGVKIHLLHVINGTRLCDMYEQGLYTPLEKDEYVDITVRQLEVLPPQTVIERITGDGDKSKLAAPLWSMDKISVLGGIDKRMAQLDTWQGRLAR